MNLDYPSSSGPYSPSQGTLRMGSLTGQYAGQMFNPSQLPSDYWSSQQQPAQSGSSGSMGGMGGSIGGSGMVSGGVASTTSLPSSIAPPSLSPYSYSADSQSYPTYLRNLGEMTSQQAFQRSTNRISSGNSAQNLMHAQDNLNQSRLGYMAQAGKEQLGVDNALSDNWNKYNTLLAQLYGTQVQQRGQDVGYAGQIGAASMRAQSGGPAISMGGGSGGGGGGGGSRGGGGYGGASQQGPNGMSQAPGSFKSIQDTLNSDLSQGTRSLYDRGYF